MDELVRFIHEQDERDTERKHIKIHLHHATLLRLADTGFIDYGPWSRTVRYLGPEVVELWLDYEDEARDGPLE